MQQSPSTRRDPRFELGHDTGEVSFVSPDGGTMFVAELTAVSVAGLSFRVADDSTAGLEPGTTLSPVTVSVGHCSVNGSITIRNVRPSAANCGFGCLFVPMNEADEERWMILLEGFEAATGAARAAAEG